MPIVYLVLFPVGIPNLDYASNWVHSGSYATLDVVPASGVGHTLSVLGDR